MMPRVVVTGGSVGGLTAALVLRDAGCDVTVFERSSAALGAAGAAVTTERELAAALADALARPGPTVIDAAVDPACYPAVMDLSRGQAGRRSVPGISRASHRKEHAR